MKKIDDFEEFNKVIQRHKNKAGNYFYLKSKTQNLIDDNRLYYENCNGNLLIFEKCSLFYRMFFFLENEDFSDGLAHIDKSVVVELPFNGSLSTDGVIQEKILLSNGFELARQSSQMTVRPQNLSGYNDAKDPRLTFDYGVMDEIPQYMEMLYKTFNPLFAFLPDERDMARLINEKCILCAYYDGKLAGILNAEPFNGNVWARHIAISNDFRGMGIGGRLLYEGHRIHKEECREFKSWVDVHNIPSVKLHEKIGYSFDNRKANEYVFEPSNAVKSSDSSFLGGYWESIEETYKETYRETNKEMNVAMIRLFVALNCMIAVECGKEAY